MTDDIDVSSTSSKSKIAIVGGGIFGVVTALELERIGCTVDLYEKNKDILMAASGSNQFRSHRGFHYPRSPQTILSCKNTTPVFEEQFLEAIVPGEHYYCIAREKSFVSADAYLEICTEYGLTYEIATLDCIDADKIALTIKVDECAINIEKLKEILWHRLKKSQITVHLNQQVGEEIVSRYDFVVVAGYANNNSFFTKSQEYQEIYQFELCEKPLVRMPATFRNKSIVVMDGPFFCIDPFGTTDLHLFGNVRHALHKVGTGVSLEIPKKFQGLLDNGLIKNPSTTRWPDFLESVASFIPEARNAEHVGSFYTVRAVLPYREDTDERPTIVKRKGDKVVTIFSGKIGSCIEAAHEVVRIVRER